MSAGCAPTSSLDPFGEDVLADPYPMHDQLRELGPVVWLERYDVWAMARYEHVHAALADPFTYCSAAGVGLSDFRKEPPWRPPSLLLEADPPAHTRARRPVTRAMSPGTVRGLRQRFVETAVGVFDLVAGQGVIDGMSDIAVPYPLRVFCDAVGVGSDGAQNLLTYGDMVFNGFGPRNRLFEESMADAAPIRQWIAARSELNGLTADGIGARIHGFAADEGFAPDERALLVRSLLSAGVDTTVHGIGNALLCLASDAEQYARLHADPQLAGAAFEEALRLEASVQTFFRTTTVDVDIDGVRIPAGHKVLLFLGAANRDHRRWPDPHRFDITRPPQSHVGFGVGVHACVGAAMARLEGEVLLAEFARRYAGVALAGEPVRQLSNTLRGLRELPLRVRPA
jgi:4-methoxybenzoate monooxygenase (O-demethylating)